MNYLPLLGIALVVLGFALRFNPLLVVAVSAIVTGLLGGMDFLKVLGALGHGFNENRFVTITYIVLPVIGVLERFGLQERARALISKIRGATVGRLLIGYLAFRQIFAALGLKDIAGPAQTVRPLVAPMAEAAAARQRGDGGEQDGEPIRALAAATDNIGLFFGEDIFIAIGSILLMRGVLEGYGVRVEPFQLSVWAIPTALAAFLVHGARLWWLDRRLRRRAR